MVLEPLCGYPPMPTIDRKQGKRSLLTNQTLLIMKITAILLLTACLQVSARGYSQNVSLSMQEASLDKVFLEIKKQTGYTFIYTESILQQANKITVSIKNVSLEQALEAVLKDKGLGYSIVDKTIIIRKKEDLQPSEQAVEQKTTIDVSGRVTDADGNSLAGASVKVKGTTIGTTTDAAGMFVLKGIDENAVLVFSYAEHETVELKVSSRTTVTASLKRDEKAMQEVIINKGYYTEKQKYSVSNVGKVTAKDIEKQPVANPLLALQGRVPGLYIEQASGISGSGVKVRIQGQNSLAKGTDPLYVVDGVPYPNQLLPNLGGGILGSSGTSESGNPLNYINPRDIETIEVLKDADATAIYGSMAANGAILITTKKGKTGETTVNLNAQTGWGKVTRRLDVLNTQQYLAMRREAFFMNDGLTTASTQYATAFDINGLWDTTRYTDWQKELTGGTAQYNDMQLSISGGNSNTQFLVNGGYHRETTVFPGDLSDEKGSLHVNINNSSSNQRFRFQLTGTYLGDNNNLISTDLTPLGIKLAPNAPALYNANGDLNWAPRTNGSSSWSNPLSFLTRKYENRTNSLIGNSILSYVLMSGLELKTNLGYSNLWSNEVSTLPVLAFSPERRPLIKGSSLFGDNNISSWIVEPQLNYKREIKNLTLELLGGTTIHQLKRNGQQLSGTNYNSDAVLEDIKSAGAVTVTSSTNTLYKYNAAFVRLNLNWQNKYILNLTGRRDGSSRFGSENLFHNFLSGAAAWIFSNEGFLQRSLPFLSFGKLKASYGTTGNDQIGDYTFMNLYSPITSTVPYQNTPGLVPNGIPNPYLQWEETRKLNIGLDLGFLHDLIMITGNYFRNRSSNQLLPYVLPITTGFDGINPINFPATIENSGWEFLLTSTNIRKNNFRWNSSFNLTIPKNKLVEFPNIASSAYANEYIVGEAITIFKTFHFLGVDPATGLYRFLDSKGNPTSAPDWNSDRTVIINKAPKFYGGLQNSIMVGNFELDFLFQFAKQIGANYRFGNSPGRFFGTSNVANEPVTILNRWQKPGDVTNIQRVGVSSAAVINAFGNATSSDAAFSDASYVRLKNVSLSWQLPETWKNRMRIQNFRLYVQGQNLLTITNYIGIDPENQSTINMPPLRVLTIGIQIGF